jgi:hypothetical protein
MQQQLRRLGDSQLLGLFLAGLLLTTMGTAQQKASPAETALAPGTFRVTVIEGQIAVEANQAPIAAILTEIGQQTGIEMDINLDPKQTITTRFDPIPLREALGRLANNVAVLTTEDSVTSPHGLTKVYVFGTEHAELLQESTDQRPPQTEIDRRSSQGENAEEESPQPTPFEFTLDPSQHLKKSP